MMTITLKQASSLLLLASSLGVSAPSLAIPIHITATGTITEVSGLDEYANVGDTWTFEATYESDTANTHPFPNRGSYAGLQDFRVTVGTTEFNAAPSTTGTGLGNDLAVPGTGSYREYFYLAGGFESSVLGVNLLGEYIFDDLANGLLPSHALPTDPLVIETFFQQVALTTPRIFTIADMRDDPEPLWIYGSLSSVTASVVSVPEPSALALLLPALMGLGLARRKQRLAVNAA